MYEADVATMAVMSILAFTSIVGNSLVCAVVKRNRDMRIPINYLLVNLAVTDIIYSIFIIPVIVLKRLSFAHLEGETGKVLCTLLTDGTLAWVGACSSIFTLIVIATERYYAVVCPHGKRGKLTTGKLKVVIPGSWILSLILSIPEFVKKVNENNECNYAEKWVAKAYFLTWFAYVFTASAVMVGFYSSVVYTLWFQRNDDNELTYQQQGVLRVRKRVTLMVVTVSAIFGICWPTDLTLHFLKDIVSYDLSPTVFSVTHTVIMINSAVNPSAYALINQRFRKKIKAMLCNSSSSSPPRVHSAREPQDTNITIQSSLTAGPISKK